jgi:hypothetical protein
VPQKDNVRIAPPEGRLGVLTPGVVAFATTFIAGVEAVKRGEDLITHLGLAYYD